MRINNIILDFGGILYRINYMKTIEEFKKLSTSPETLDSLDIKKIQDLPELFERGQIGAQEFRNAIINQYCLICDDFAFDMAWNSMLLGVQAGSYEFIKQLGLNYRLALLSNTNSIHYEYFAPQVRTIESEIKQIYYSHLIGMRKPNHNIYYYVLKENNFSPSETLFIDDTKENTDAAEELGIHTINFERNGDLSELLHTIEIYSQTKRY